MKARIWRIALMGLLGACAKYSPEIQGHRGARGLMPENTIPGFIKALELGVDVLELDVVISKDQRVMVSHEPWLSHEICLDPNKNPIYQSTEQAYNMYELTMEQIQQAECGLLPHTRFAEQKKISAYKPRLGEVIDTVNAWIKENEPKRKIRYNIEIKSRPEWDDVFTPGFEEFCDLVLGVIKRKDATHVSTLQSFDVRSLNYLNQIKAPVDLVLLVDENENYLEKIKQLQFTPKILSPHYSLVSSTLMEYARSHNMKVIPWTVNDVQEANRLFKLHVDGLITDYPDRINKL